MKTKKGEKERLRTVILDKAVQFLKRHGRVGSGTNQMMKHAGLTRGALYSHFKSKDDLFAQAICHDLSRLEETLAQRFRDEGGAALKRMIEDHLSERSLTDVEESCAFTSLSSDMQRCKPAHRALYEDYMVRIYALFADALKSQFPQDSPDESHAKATNLYSGLVGTLTMARTMKDPKRAREILESGKKFLMESFVPSARKPVPSKLGL
ncbi:MAG TPA: TetR/AcrR family transcriptional regulator [Planctomycetota bacterium]|nr:TetR/AcrR family transcriptional regulator [Planctomycetota bacterium]